MLFAKLSDVAISSRRLCTSQVIAQLHFGGLTVGRAANLVLLDSNPLERIENTERIFAVILRGKLYQRPELERLLAEAERLALLN